MDEKDAPSGIDKRENDDDRKEPGEEDVRNRDAGIDQRTGGAGSADETPRAPQAGL